MASFTLDRLPRTFTYSQARRIGMSDRALYALRDQGTIELIGRGLFRRADLADTADIDLVEIAHRAREATLCLASALARHGLTDLIPPAIDVAIPRGRRAPKTRAPVAWHRFDPMTFDVGRDALPVEPETSIGLYCPRRCLIDAFRLRHQEGPELAHTALRRWLERPGSHPAELLDMACSFPRAQRTLRQSLDILL